MNLFIKTKGQGPALVLFHGWGFDHSVWLDLAEQMQHKFQLHLVDLPGFGNSELMDWKNFKQNLLSQLPKHFAVLGWSMGGLYAMRLAVEEQQRVSHLLITASSPKFIKEPDWPGVEKRVFDGFFANLAEDPQGTITEFINLQLQNQSYLPLNPYISSIEGLTSGLQILEEWDLREALLNYKRPACFIFGRLDAITPRRTLITMEKKYPEFCYVLFPKAAHMPFLSDQEEYLSVVEKFLQ